MNIRAQHKYLKVSPKKIRFVAKSIKKLTPAVALSRLALIQNVGAKMLYKAIKSAIDNGVATLKVNPANLAFQEVKVDEGVFLKRMRPGSRGMGRPYLRRTSHITIVLQENKVETKVEKKMLKAESVTQPKKLEVKNTKKQ